MDDSYWAEVERARLMTPSERMSEGLRLRDEWYAQLLVDIRKENPGITEEAALLMRSEMMAEMSRQRSAEKMMVLEMIAADAARLKAQQDGAAS